MKKAKDTHDDDDPFDFRRFLSAQEEAFGRVVSELRSGEKRSHWMWYIFPQIDGLGHSATSRRFAIKSLREARHYLVHPILGKRLLLCAEIVLSIEGRSVSEIFMPPDDVKLKSSMTLFELAGAPGSVFARVLDKYFHGERDARTLGLLKNLKAGEEEDGV